jgi:hypothetical protein
MKMKAVVLSRPSVQAVVTVTVRMGFGSVAMSVIVGFMVNVLR